MNCRQVIIWSLGDVDVRNRVEQNNRHNVVSLGHFPPSLRWFCRSLGVTGGDFEQNPVRIKWKPRKSLKNQRNSMKSIKNHDVSRKFPNLFSTQKLKNKVFSMIKQYYRFRIFFLTKYGLCIFDFRHLRDQTIILWLLCRPESWNIRNSKNRFQKFVA